MGPFRHRMQALPRTVQSGVCSDQPHGGRSHRNARLVRPRPSPGCTMARDTSRDGFVNKLRSYVLTHFAWFWRLADRWPWLGRAINRTLINTAVTRAQSRPYALSTMAPYLVGVPHRPDLERPALPPKSWDHLPDPDVVAELFRAAGREAPVSAVHDALPAFAQWFTDGFLRDRLRQPAQEHLEPRDRPEQALRPERDPDPAPAGARARRQAEEPDDQRRGVRRLTCTSSTTGRRSEAGVRGPVAATAGRASPPARCRQVCSRRAATGRTPPGRRR